MRIVLDTNILVSALISKGTPPYALQQAWQAGKYVLVTSQAQLDEAKRVFGYEKLKRFIKPKEAEELLANLESEALIVLPMEGIAWSRDPADNQIIETALAGKVDHLVTGDKADLLALGSVEGVPIITARQALDILRLDDL